MPVVPEFTGARVPYGKRDVSGNLVYLLIFTSDMTIRTSITLHEEADVTTHNSTIMIRERQINTVT